MTSKVYAWRNIADGFTDGLVLSNGASIAFNQSFRYSSLRAKAEELGLITDDVQRVFQHLNTADFELVLRMLWHASRINEALKIDDPRTSEAYSAVREALIEVVGAVHPPHAAVADRLATAARFMLRFSTVASLNYDFLVYWALLDWNERVPHRFKDCFVHSEFQQDWRWLRTPFGDCDRTTIVVYPHGNLALGVGLDGTEQKIASSSDKRLLDTIFDKWRSGEVAPLFVSEGTTQQKRAAIGRSPYLSTVYHEILPDISESLVMIGWSAGESDSHILDALCRGKVRRFAVGVDSRSDALHETQGTLYRKLRERLRGEPFELYFFERESSGCWISS